LHGFRRLLRQSATQAPKNCSTFYGKKALKNGTAPAGASQMKAAGHYSMLRQ
jgi:hypothetical protein